jgi:hypothetical protein
VKWVEAWVPGLKEVVLGRLRSLAATARLCWLGQSSQFGGRHGNGPGGLLVGSKARRETLLQGYEQQKQLLLSLSAGLEGEFLALGKQLGEILRKSKSVQNECRGVSELLSGQEQDRAIHFSFQLLKKAEDLVQGSYNQYHSVFEVFTKLASGLREIEARQEQLRCELRPLPLISIQFRIQAGVFDKATRDGFLNLASELNTLLQELDMAVERQFQDLAEVQASCGRLMVELSEIIELHKSKISQTLQACREQLATLNQSFLQYETVVRDLSSQSTGVQKGVNSVIIALQCQDIICQKIQQVGQALDEMVRYVQAASRLPRKPEGQVDLEQLLAHESEVQLREIQAVFSQLDEAARQITDGIQLVENQVNALTDQALTIGKNAVEASVMEQSVQGMRGILSIVTASVFNVNKVASALEPLKVKFTQCTEQVSTLAHGVRLAALNAQIFAIRVERGAVLEVLAEQTRGISELILCDVRTIDAQVHDLSASLENLQQRLANYYESSHHEEIVLIREATRAESKLEQIKRELPRRLGLVRPMQKELTTLTKQTPASVCFPARVEELKGGVLEFFQRHARVGASSPQSGNDTRYRRSYAVAHENDLPQAALRANGQTVHVESPASMASLPRPSDPAEADACIAPGTELFDSSLAMPAPGNSARTEHGHEGTARNSQQTEVSSSQNQSCPEQVEQAVRRDREASRPGDDLGPNIELF